MLSFILKQTIALSLQRMVIISFPPTNRVQDCGGLHLSLRW